MTNFLVLIFFSIFVGLGLPCFAYPLTTGSDYDGIKDGGIVVLLLLLMVILLAFYVLVYLHNWEIRYWLACVYMTPLVLHLSLN